MIKKASELLDVLYIEKEAGLGDTVKKFGKGVKNQLKETGTDIKRSFGVEKFTPKHDAGTNAFIGAGLGAATGAAGAAATNNGDDNTGAAVKGAVLGGLAGAGAGAVGSKYLNSKDAKAFTDRKQAFTRGSMTSTGTRILTNQIKKVMPDAPKQKLVDLYNKVKDSTNEATGAVKKTVNDTKENLKEFKDEFTGHVK